MSPQPPRPVAADLIDAFWRDGAVALRGVFDPTWVDLARQGVEQNLRSPSQFAEHLRGDDDDGEFFSDYCNWRRIPALRRFVLESPAAELAAAVMRSSRVNFYHDHVLVKSPTAQRRTPWHHDQPYYPIDGRQCCSIWLPLDPVLEDASIRFVRGSHDWGRMFTPRKFATERDYDLQDGQRPSPGDSVPEIDEERHDILRFAVAPGDCVVFHMATLHGAPGNPSDSASRRVLATRWLGDDVRFAARPWEISPPIAGGLSPGDAISGDDFPTLWPPPREG